MFFRKKVNPNLEPAKAILALHHAAASLSPGELAGEIEILLHRLGPNEVRRVQKAAIDVAWAHLG